MVDKLDGMSKDIVKENIKKLKELFPTIVKEDKINFEELQLILGEDINNNKEQYSFVWNGKTEATKLAQKRSTGTLRPCIEESKDWDTTKNIYIEGDNLEVLKLLQTSYNGRIKMIYIDPPYNTGHDFVYKDNFEDNIANYKEITGQAQKSNADTDGRYHTNWLNMMYPRLRLARTLLSKEGVIFISIDDNEQANLKKICDDIFGENNFIAQFPRVTKKGGKSSDIIAKNHDYVLMYKKGNDCVLYPIEHNDDGFKNKDEYFEERGFYKLNQTLDYDSLQYSKSLDYPLEINGKIFYAGGSYESYLARQEGKHNNADWAWRWSKSKFEFGLKNGFIVLKKTKNGERIYTKTYQNATIEDKINGYEIVYKDRTKSMSTLDTTLNEYSNDNATKDLDNILDKKLFDFSKPISLIKLFLKLSTKKDDIILDFFSGSASTAQAVFEQNLEELNSNLEDKGNRKFILVQLPEKTEETSEAFRQGYKNICEIGKARIREYGRRQVDGAKLQYNQTKEKIDSLEKKDEELFLTDTEKSILAKTKILNKHCSDILNLDYGFKVFKLDTSNLKKWNNAPTKDANEVAKRIQLSLDYLESDRTELDLVYEIMLKYGLDLTLPITKSSNEKAFIVNGEEYKLLICSEMNLTLDDIESFANESVGTYLFADRCFADDNLLINTQEILKSRNKEMRLF